MTDQRFGARAQPPTGRARRAVPGLTACRLCAGETLGEDDPRPGGQLERVREIAASGHARLTVVDCLDACERGDILVVRPIPDVRARQRPVWFERLAGEDLTTELQGWLSAGGPGIAPLPEPLRPLVLHLQQQVPPDRAPGSADVNAGV
ncbi:hypothetical protein [Cellulosimicrobium sp. Marseille-Q8652]